MVAGGHALVVFQTAGWPGSVTKGLLFFCNGDAAVTLFFVLSGVVLGMGLQRAGRGSASGLAAYSIRRFFRIYPMFLLTTLGILAFLAWGDLLMAGHANWFNMGPNYRPSVLNLNAPPAPSVVATNLLMLNPSLNLVTWTLGVEMLCSLLLPLAHYARVRLPASGTWLLLLFAVFGVFIPKWLLLLGLVRLEGALPWQYLGFFPLFYGGYLLPVHGPRLFSWCTGRAWGRRTLLVAALVGFLSANLFRDEHRFVAGICAWIILGIVLFGGSQRLRWFLELPVTRFYGKISYSFYLLHDLVLIVMARTAAEFVLSRAVPSHPLLANCVLVIVSVGVVTGLAWWTHRAIETPCIARGKRLAERLKGMRMPRLAGAGSRVTAPAIGRLGA